MGQKTTTSDLIESAAAAAEVDPTDIRRVFDVLTAVTTAALNDGKAVAFGRLGTFKPVERAARTGRNPRTGEPVEIASSRAVKFTPAKALKETMNG